jgi:hypothetical protein
MLLNEFIYFDEDQAEMYDKDRYDPNHDTSIVDISDLRKDRCRLTLKMLNNLRKAGDAREREKKEELALVRTMYAPPPVEGAGGLGGMPAL